MTLQGEPLGLARTLGHVLAALELLTQDDGRSPRDALFAAGPPAERLTAVREELVLARTELAALQGTGDALLSSAGRLAKSQQRADPSHSPHFGG